MRVKLLFILFLFFLSGCSSPSEVKDLIRGKWYFESGDVYIKISKKEYTIKNDSPMPEDYKLIGDSLIVKGFEASLFPEKYWDTVRILKLNSDTLILKDSERTLILHKK